MLKRKLQEENRIGWFIAWYSPESDTGGLIKYKEENEAVITEDILRAIKQCKEISDT